ncbi:MAG: ribosome biogenesis GTPase Der [Chloroflexi bacterium]|nr:ribosome biogenesis GTPase Der [Chloroflexota bacterium]
MALPTVAIVGRPNVGKSTLFNRLVRHRMAIVSDIPGTTRDRIFATVTWDVTSLTLVDTGGLVPEAQEELWVKMRGQIEQAMARADVIIFLTEASTGLHPADAEIANSLRRLGVPVVLAVNKAEGPGRQLQVSEFHRLGLGDPIPISALHNQGVADLMDHVVALLPAAKEAGEREAEERVLKLAIVGRPNVGKSSLLNAIVGEERAIVLPEPGTTRDALDTPMTYGGQRVVLIDTAGLRRRGHIEPGIEQFSALRALDAIQRCNVAILVLDAGEGITAQDTHVAGYVVEAYRGLVIAINKWDLARATGVDEATALQDIRRRFRWATYVPVRFTVAVTGEGVNELMEVALEVHQERWKEIDQGELNRTLLAATAEHPPPSKGRRRLRIYRALHSGVNPPTVSFYVNDPELLSFSYRRFLENKLRSAFGFKGNHLRLVFRQQEGVRR